MGLRRREEKYNKLKKQGLWCDRYCFVGDMYRVHLGEMMHRNPANDFDEGVRLYVQHREGWDSRRYTELGSEIKWLLYHSGSWEHVDRNRHFFVSLWLFTWSSTFCRRTILLGFFSSKFLCSLNLVDGDQKGLRVA